jgi:CcmD family protein
VNNPLYLVVGFGITWAAIVWYTWRISRRTHAATSELAGHGGDSGRGVAS